MGVIADEDQVPVPQSGERCVGLLPIFENLDLVSVTDLLLFLENQFALSCFIWGTARAGNLSS